MNNENKNPNVEEELKKQETAENEQTTSEASEAQENASSEEKELTAEEKLGKEIWKKLRKSSTSRKTNTASVC